MEGVTICVMEWVVGVGFVLLVVMEWVAHLININIIIMHTLHQNMH